jgi:CheY-like chemotaxis protein
MVLDLPAIKIVLADDDEDDRSIFNEAFEELHLGSYLKMFSAGSELLHYLKSTNDELPELLFLDLNMPCMSGLQCLHEIRSDKKLRRLSVAILSTSSSQSEIEKSFEGGANLYIKKPSEFIKLKQIISDVIQINWKSRRRRTRSKFYYKVDYP